MAAEPIRVVLIEDQALFRQSLAAVLKSRSNLAVVGEYGSVESVRAVATWERVAEVALIDVRLGKEHSFALAAELTRTAPSLRLIWMTSINEGYLLEEAFAANLPGFVHKDDPLEVLLVAIETVAAGGRYCSESVVRLRRQQRANPEHFSRILSAREQQVLKLIGSGLDNNEVAAMLGLSAGTVQSHRRNMMGRLNLHSAAELQAYALTNGFVDVSTLRSNRSDGRSAT